MSSILEIPCTPEQLAERANKIPMTSVSAGPFSPARLIPTEDVPAFDRLGKMLFDHFAPEGAYEIDLTHGLHEAEWQLKGMQLLESAFHQIITAREMPQVEAGLDPAQRRQIAAALGFEKNARLVDQLSRQVGRLTRRRDATRKELRAVQAERRERTSAKPSSKSKPAVDPHGKPYKIPALDGFVPDENFMRMVKETMGSEDMDEDDLQELLKNF